MVLPAIAGPLGIVSCSGLLVSPVLTIHHKSLFNGNHSAAAGFFQQAADHRNKRIDLVFRIHNFYAVEQYEELYFVDGVNKAHAFDGSILTPIVLIPRMRR